MAAPAHITAITDSQAGHHPEVRRRSKSVARSGVSVITRSRSIALAGRHLAAVENVNLRLGGERLAILDE